MAIIVRADCLGRAHEQMIEKVLTKGLVRNTEDDEATVELREPGIIHVENPFADYRASPQNKFGPKATEEYGKALLQGNPVTQGGFSYTYNARLFDWYGRINQIDRVIKKLMKDPLTRRAQAITWYPGKDIDADDPPCLQRMQFIQIEGKLCMDVDMRSNDSVSALGANMVAFTQLQKLVADAINLPVGWYEHKSTSMHAYYIRDIKEVSRYVEAGGYFARCVPEVQSALTNAGFVCGV